MSSNHLFVFMDVFVSVQGTRKNAIIKASQERRKRGENSCVEMREGIIKQIPVVKRGLEMSSVMQY